MARFDYTALDLGGKVTEGREEAESVSAVHRKLQSKNLQMMHITEVRDPVFHLRALPFDQLLGVTQQLSTLLSAHVPLVNALTAIADQSPPKTQKLCLHIQAQVRAGQSFSAALALYPRIFSPMYCASVQAGEQSASLGKVFHRLVEHLEREKNFKQKIQQASIYPCVMGGCALLITGVLLSTVVPTMMGIIEDAGQALPWWTRVVWQLSLWVRSDAWMVLLGVCTLGFLHHRAMRVPSYRMRFHKWLLHLPCFGRWWQWRELSYFAHTLSLLLGAGLVLTDALSIAEQVVQALPMRRALAKVSQSLKEGESWLVACKKSGYFPPMALHLLAAGENGGQLSEMLYKMARYLEQEVSFGIHAGLRLLEPLFILIMGGVVMGIVLAVLLPIFEMNTWAF